MAACMAADAGVGVWLGPRPSAVYQHYVAELGPAALHDQRLAATIMWAGGLPAFAVPLLARTRGAITRRRPPRQLRARRGQPPHRRGEAPA